MCEDCVAGGDGHRREREADSDAFVLSTRVNPYHTAFHHFSLGQQRGGLPNYAALICTTQASLCMQSPLSALPESEGGTGSDAASSLTVGGARDPA